MRTRTLKRMVLRSLREQASKYEGVNSSHHPTKARRAFDSCITWP